MAYAYGTQINKNYISSTAFLDQREILNKVLDITNEESSFLDVMELTGRSIPTSVPVYHHFVNSELFQLCTSTAGVSAAAASAQTLSMSSADVAYINTGDLLLGQAGAVWYVSAKPSSTSVSVVSVDKSTASVAVSEKFAVFSNAAGEGSLSPDARKWAVVKYLNQVQTFKAKFQISDIQKASKVEVDFNGKPFYMYKGQHDSLVKFRADISNALMFGKISATAAPTSAALVQSGFPEGAGATLVDAEGNPVSTTMGLDQYATLYGVNQTQGTAGTYSLAEFATLTQNLNKLRAPQEYFLFVGTSMNIAFDNLLNNLGNSGITAGVGISGAARFMINGKELDLGIDKVKLYGRQYYKKLLPILDHQNIVNTGSSHKLAESAYGVPATKQKTVDGQMLDRLQVRYMAGDGLDLRYREILLGGLAPVPTNERSVLEIHYQSTQGLQVLGANHIFKIKGV